MIGHFSDHAANERTFLAWVRAAIAVMAFGFLVEKFDIFLKIAARSLAPKGGHAVSVPATVYGGAAGIVLILAGTIMVALAAIRFGSMRRAIDSADTRTDGARIDLALAGILVVLGLALVLYLAHTVVSSA